jgi:hypothetical protein
MKIQVCIFFADHANAESLCTVYVCGDSHCLSSSWSHIQIKSRSFRLEPRLVTGLKLWHLRKDSHFYPKETFKRAVATIPDGSTVVNAIRIHFTLF